MKRIDLIRHLESHGVFCFAKALTTAFTTILQHNARAQFHGIEKSKTPQPSEFASSLQSQIRFAECAEC